MSVTKFRAIMQIFGVAVEHGIMHLKLLSRHMPLVLNETFQK
jgi:hypothetical protein